MQYQIKTQRVFKIFSGPERRFLWLQTPRIDDWTAPKEVTQLPIPFLIGDNELSKREFLVYLDEIKTMDNNTTGILFRGKTIDPINGQGYIIEGQYDYAEKTGLAEVTEYESPEDDEDDED